jgi:hypothetical protein
MAQSLWKIPDVSHLRPPVIILKEQASSLANETQGVLVGEVRTLPTSNQSNMQFTLDIVVPSLNSYRFTVLQINQPLTMYPLSVLPFYGSNSQINDETQLTTALADILSSDQMQRVISSLLTQAANSMAG